MKIKKKPQIFFIILFTFSILTASSLAKEVGKDVLYPASNSFLWVIKFYQWVISPQIKAGCKFYPSCSNFSYEAIRKHGIFWGTLMTSERLQRCHSCGGFYYPVRHARYYDTVERHYFGPAKE